MCFYILWWKKKKTISSQITQPPLKGHYKRNDQFKKPKLQKELILEFENFGIKLKSCEN